MDRDAYASGEERPIWRSQEIEKQRARDATGVTDAANHPVHGRAASLRNTVGICAAAILALTLMVVIGTLTQTHDTPLSRNVVVIPSGQDRTFVSLEPSDEAADQVLTNLGLAAFAVEREPSVGAEPNRASCDAIRGTPYASESEHVWYQANCVIEETVAAYVSSPGLGGAVVGPEPSTSSDASRAVTASDAIASSIDWIIAQEDAIYEVAAGACSASEVGALWLVSCETSLRNCDFEECTSWVSLCVTDARGELLANQNC